jgi:hypothetical protein
MGTPRCRPFIEIQSQRDLEVLTKIYANSVLLGDQSENGWGIRYATEFHMTNDSKLFPPRPKWEEWGYRPDEYSRWIKGPWKPIEQLYAELGVKALPEGERRCAQPPYDKLPIPRADIPAGVILSREAGYYIHENDVPTVTFTDANGDPLKVKITNEDGEKEEVDVAGPAIAQPVYNAKMINLFDFSSRGWVSGKGRGAKWHDIGVRKILVPEYLMGDATFALLGVPTGHSRVLFKDISTAVHFRTTLATITPCLPAVNAVPVLATRRHRDTLSLQAMMGSYCLDFAARRRIGYLHLNQFVIDELPLAARATGIVAEVSGRICSRLCFIHEWFTPAWLSLQDNTEEAVWRGNWALSDHERTRLRCALDAVVACCYELDAPTFRMCLDSCDLPRSVTSGNAGASLPAKGFWRVDKDKHPEHRHTVLSLVAFHDLQEKIDAGGGDVTKGIEAFCNQNDGEGWMLPETLRLADYGLGHDERAKEHQPVRECFGPRFYDWQLAQSPEESWKECHLHARNLLGEAGYQALVDELAGKAPAKDEKREHANPPKGMLFDTTDLPLFRTNNED